MTAEAWPEADVLFHRDPRWLGADDAYSIDLGEGRVAWFFGDSFVAPTVAGQRKGTTMVRNSIGIQTGYDPTRAKFKSLLARNGRRANLVYSRRGRQLLLARWRSDPRRQAAPVF